MEFPVIRDPDKPAAHTYSPQRATATGREVDVVSVRARVTKQRGGGPGLRNGNRASQGSYRGWGAPEKGNVGVNLVIAATVASGTSKM